MNRLARLDGGHSAWKMVVMIGIVMTMAVLPLQDAYAQNPAGEPGVVAMPVLPPVTVVPSANPVVPQLPATGLQSGKVYVLAIGINDYQYLSRMRACVNNARLFADVFGNGKRAATVTLLVDQQATKAAMLSVLKNYKSQLTAQDQLIVYYSGQGGQNSMQWQTVVGGPQYAWRDENVYDETIMPYDATYRRDNQLTSDELSDILKTLPTQQITIMTDTCYSRTMVQSVAPSFNTVKQVRRPRLSVRDLSMYGYNILAASDWNETPWDDILDGQVRGVFTHYLVQGMHSKAADTKADGQLTVNEIYEYARSMTVQYIGVQHPQLYRGRDPECVVWEL